MYQQFIEQKVPIKRPKTALKLLFKEKISDRYVFCFDIDDTLIQSTNKIRVKSLKKGKEKAFSTREFERYSAQGRLEKEGMHVDFTEFIDDKISYA